MTKEGIIEYLRIVKDVETDIYLTNTLITKIDSESGNNNLTVPAKPLYPQTVYAQSLNGTDLVKDAKRRIIQRYIWIILIPVILLICCIFARDSVSGNMTLGLITFFSFPICTSCYACIYAVSYSRACQKCANEINRINLKKYNSELAQYEVLLKKYNNDASEVKNRKNRNEIAKSELAHYVEVLRNMLTKLYEVGVLYPKYHDWVAICSFIEYFESGRCETLDGPEGAYNIFESEKRQNLIISELSKIQDKMETIKANQYELYNALTGVNSLINSSFSAIIYRQDLTMLENRVNTQKIVTSNYFAQIR